MIALPSCPLLRSVVMATATLLAAAGLGGALGIHGCTSADPQIPSVTWDGSAYAVAWASPEDGGSTIYTHRFFERDFRGAGNASSARDRRKPTRVYRASNVLGPPELVHGREGYLLFVHRQNARSLIALPLDKQARRRGRPRDIAHGVSRVCTAPAHDGNAFVAAWTQAEQDGEDTLRLAVLDRSGAVVAEKRWEVQGPGRCSVAAAPGRVALLWQSQGGRARMWEAIPNGPALESRELTLGSNAPGPLRIVATTSGWAALRAQGRRLEVVVMARGRPDRTIEVPRQVSPESVDLGVNERGLFVTWLDKNRVHVLGIPQSRHATGAIPRGSLGTRALGHGDRAVVAWTSKFGQSVHVARISEFP